MKALWRQGPISGRRTSYCWSPRATHRRMVIGENGPGLCKFFIAMESCLSIVGRKVYVPKTMRMVLNRQVDHHAVATGDQRLRR